MAERRPPGPLKDDEQKFMLKNVQLFKNETLGTGSYGAVCKAKCDQLICAAKLLYPVLFQMQAPDPGKEHRQPFRRFEQECRFLSRVNHPNIVQYLGTYRDPETNAPVLLMELMDESLTHFLESSPGDIPYHIQVNLSQDIAQALAFLHANGIIHRDLSSNNVLLIAGNRAKVTDFGMSRFEDINKTRLATMTTCPGTPAFMSPEALDEPPVYTEKLDNFSFGVLLVQIVTRQFPAPGDRFETVLIPSPRHPTRMVKSRLAIPEIERRQAHISLIEPTHPLLPIALECLKDEAVERPSSQQLCQSLDALKKTARYEESSKHGDRISNTRSTSSTQQKAQELQGVNSSSGRAALAEGRESQQMKRLNQQLEAKEEATAALQQGMAEKEREIAELREMLARKKELSMEAVQEAIQSIQTQPPDPVRLMWEFLPNTPPCSYKTTNSAAVVGNKVYITLDFAVWEYSGRWISLPKHSLSAIALVGVENELITVGGYADGWVSLKESNKVYSYAQGAWVKKYPPMPNKRSSCGAVYAKALQQLIVIGGIHVQSQVALPVAAIDVLNTFNKQWSTVKKLPFPISWPSVALCGDYIYAYSGWSMAMDKYSVVRCPLQTVASSSAKWENVASAPFKGSTLVSMEDHLLAVGGEGPGGDSTKYVCMYNPSDDSWRLLSEMKTPRSQCAVVLLPDDQLMVVGGNIINQTCELASFK